MSNGHINETPEQLYASALALLEQGQHEDALKTAQKLWSQVRDRGVAGALPALNLLGEISVELGDAEAATRYFESAVQLDPVGDVPETLGGGAEKFLWLAQLCREGGRQSVQWFERGVKALQNEIVFLEGGGLLDVDQETLLMMRMEKKRKLANALCGIVEVYMTDLSWEDDAELRCENLITEAMSVEEETSAEILQTLASVRLSQERKDEARVALRRSIETWESLEPEDPAVPDFASRISLSRLLMEAEMEFEAMGILGRLVGEDDQSIEAWYLGGWCQYLMCEREKARVGSSSTIPHAVEHDIASEKLNRNPDSLQKGSRRWLKTAIRLYEVLDYEDDRLFQHANELVAGLDVVLGPEDEQAEGEADEDYDDEWEGIVDYDEKESEDEQMNGS